MTISILVRWHQGRQLPVDAHFSPLTVNVLHLRFYGVSCAVRRMSAQARVSTRPTTKARHELNDDDVEGQATEHGEQSEHSFQDSRASRSERNHGLFTKVTDGDA
jgi:hypothetical protein